MPWSLNVGRVRIGDLEEVLNEAVGGAPLEMFSKEEHGEQVSGLISTVGSIIDSGLLGDLDDEALVDVAMNGNANDDYVAGSVADSDRTYVTVSVSRTPTETEATPTA